MSEARHCAECGGELTADPGLRDLCPRCLLILGLGADPANRRTIGNYEILCELGRGGMGIVYKAYEGSLNRIVALKVISEPLAHDHAFVKRFQREARIAAQLNHPNIVAIHAVGEHEGQHFIAMECVKGRSLAAVIKEEGQMEPHHAVQIASQVIEALAEAHRQGIVHRDISPQNIIVESVGRVKVLDFGLAKALHSGTGLTSNGTMLGKPPYMAPEQCRGGEADARADIYALGATLFEMLTGTPPFTGDTPLAVMHQIVETPFPKVRSLNSEVPPHLERIIEKMVAKDPTDRYQSAQALHEDVTAFLTGERETVIRSAGWFASMVSVRRHAGQPSKDAAKRFRARVGLALFVVLLLAGVAALTYFVRTRTSAPQEGVSAASSERPAGLAEEQVPTSGPIAEHRDTPPAQIPDAEQLEKYVEELKRVVAAQTRAVPSSDALLSGRVHDSSRLGSTVVVLQNGLNNLRNGRLHDARLCFAQAKTFVQNENATLLTDLHNKRDISFSPDELTQCLDRINQYNLPNPDQLIPVFVTVTRSEGEFLGVPADAFAQDVLDYAAEALLGADLPVKHWPHRAGSRYTCEIEFTLSQKNGTNENPAGKVEYKVTVTDTKTKEPVLEFADSGRFEERQWPPVVSVPLFGQDPTTARAKRIFEPSCMDLERHFRAWQLQPDSPSSKHE